MGSTPVVLAPALGAAQDVVALLAAAALPLRVHARIAGWVDAYARIGLPLATAPGPRDGAAVPRLAGAGRGGGVAARGSSTPPPSAACAPRACSPPPGWRSSPTPRQRLRVDAAFAVADHGDLPSLVAHARAAEARDVWLTSGFSDAAVARFRRRRHRRARALGPQPAMQQMTLFAE